MFEKHGSHSILVIALGTGRIASCSSRADMEWPAWISPGGRWRGRSRNASRTSCSPKELAELLGKRKEVQKFTMQGIKGEISWESGLAKRMELVKGSTYHPFLRVANSLPIMNGAVETTEKLERMGCLMVGISGGFLLFTNRMKNELGLDHVFSNELVFHDGGLVGYGVLISNKAKILQTTFGALFSGMKKMAVVDGANDVGLFDLAEVRVAFGAQDSQEESGCEDRREGPQARRGAREH